MPSPNAKPELNSLSIIKTFCNSAIGPIMSRITGPLMSIAPIHVVALGDGEPGVLDANWISVFFFAKDSLCLSGSARSRLRKQNRASSRDMDTRIYAMTMEIMNAIPLLIPITGARKRATRVHPPTINKVQTK
jgi:hypothetical protein